MTTQNWGRFAISSINDKNDDQKELFRANFSVPNSSSVTCFTVEGKIYCNYIDPFLNNEVLTYSIASGKFSVQKLDYEGKKLEETTSGQWRKEWTHFVSIFFQGKNYYIAYSSANGSVITFLTEPKDSFLRIFT
jgi:hypothetical protein